MRMTQLRKNLLVALALGCLVLSPALTAQTGNPTPLPPPAPASSSSGSAHPHHIVRFGASYFSPSVGESFDISGTNVDIDTDNALGAFVEYEWRFSNLLGLPVNIGYAKPETTFDVAGVGTATDDTTVTTASAGVNLHLFGRGWIDLRIGAYGQYASFSDDLESTYGFGGTIGADFSLGENGLAIVVDVRYSLLSPDIEDVQNTNLGDLDFDPLVAEAGLAWRF